MVMKQLNPYIPVSTSKGPGEAFMIVDYGHMVNSVWYVRFPGGKVLHFYSDDIRMYGNPMDGNGWDVKDKWWESEDSKSEQPKTSFQEAVKNLCMEDNWCFDTLPWKHYIHFYKDDRFIKIHSNHVEYGATTDEVKPTPDILEFERKLEDIIKFYDGVKGVKENWKESNRQIPIEIPKYRVKVTLKKKQQNKNTGSYWLTYNGETKIVCSKNLEYYTDNLFDLSTVFKMDEISSYNATPNIQK